MNPSSDILAIAVASTGIQGPSSSSVPSNVPNGTTSSVFDSTSVSPNFEASNEQYQLVESFENPCPDLDDIQPTFPVVAVELFGESFEEWRKRAKRACVTGVGSSTLVQSYDQDSSFGSGVQILVPQNSNQQNSNPQNSNPQNSFPQKSVPQTSVLQNSVTQNSNPQNFVPQTSSPQNYVQQNPIPQNSNLQNFVPQNSTPQTSVTQSFVPQNSNPQNYIGQNPIPQNSIPQTSSPQNSIRQIPRNPRTQCFAYQSPSHQSHQNPQVNPQQQSFMMGQHQHHQQTYPSYQQQFTTNQRPLTTLQPTFQNSRLMPSYYHQNNPCTTFPDTSVGYIPQQNSCIPQENSQQKALDQQQQQMFQQQQMQMMMNDNRSYQSNAVEQGVDVLGGIENIPTVQARDSTQSSMWQRVAAPSTWFSNVKSLKRKKN